MTDRKRKINVVGINSFEFEELPLSLQSLFIETVNIAVPDSYFCEIKSWAVKHTIKKKTYIIKVKNKMMHRKSLRNLQII